MEFYTGKIDLLVLVMHVACPEELSINFPIALHEYSSYNTRLHMMTEMIDVTEHLLPRSFELSYLERCRKQMHVG